MSFLASANLLRLMPVVDYYPELLLGNFYHIYNRVNGDDELFVQERNYNFFLKRFDHFLYDTLKRMLAGVRNDISTGNSSVNELVKVVARNVISKKLFGNH